MGRDDFHQLDFDYESSYRFGGGYRLCDCGEEIRFLFTRLSSSAADIAPSGSFLPYEVSSPPDGQTLVGGHVALRSFDLAYAKTIPLGSPLGCGCGDSCGCGDGYGCGDGCGSGCGCDGGCGGCPTWEITWSGGVRVAEVKHARAFIAVDELEEVTTAALSRMKFEGSGLRFGLEGRRYFFQNGMASMYLKGDISLLWGDIDLVAQRVVEGEQRPRPGEFPNV